jgi:hypothetical protein
VFPIDCISTFPMTHWCSHASPSPTWPPEHRRRRWPLRRRFGLPSRPSLPSTSGPIEPLWAPGTSPPLRPRRRWPSPPEHGCLSSIPLPPSAKGLFGMIWKVPRVSLQNYRAPQFKSCEIQKYVENCRKFRKMLNTTILVLWSWDKYVCFVLQFN